MPPPGTNARSDLSQFLIHLTKNGTYETWMPIQRPRRPTGYDISTYPTVTARNSLINIISSEKIEARSPFGYFKLKINRYRAYNGQIYVNGNANPDWLKSVCFSETPLKELKSFYQAVVYKRNQYQKYGLAFWLNAVKAAGGNPIFYVDSDKQHFLDALDTTLSLNIPGFTELMHLCETFGPQILNRTRLSDFRWEREWRKKDEYEFEWNHVAFGICPENEITAFETLTQHRTIFLDPDWDEVTLMNYLQQKAPHLLPYL